MAGKSNARTMLLAVASAVVLHALLLPVVVSLGTSPQAEGVLARGGEISSALPPLDERAAQASPIDLIDEAELGALLAARLGPFDAARVGDSSPLPGAEADRSGLLAAAAGGEITGGPFRETLRRDHEDQRAEIWNGNDRAQQAIEATGRRDRDNASPEAVTRQADPRFDSSTDRGARARRPEDHPRPGDAAGTAALDQVGTAVPLRDWRDADPVLDNMVASARDAGRAGRVSSSERSAVSDRGTPQSDVPRRGRLVGALDSAAASSETNPAPFELAQTATGGAGEGVAGQSGPGNAAIGRGPGTASSTAATRRGPAGESLRATRSDPYFRALYREIDRHVKFPRDLAKGLEQGTVIARFTLNPDGAISGIRVAKTSGFHGFDDALTAALRKVGPLGRVPQRLLGGAKTLRIVAPYRFSNPLIR